MIDKLAFSPDEAASLAGVGRTFIFSEIKNRRLDAVKAGSRTLITRDAMTAWLNSLPRRGTGLANTTEADVADTKLPQSRRRQPALDRQRNVPPKHVAPGNYQPRGTE